MGVSERYEEAEDERWRKLPLRERYRWRAIIIIATLVGLWIGASIVLQEEDVQCELSGGTVKAKLEQAWKCELPSSK